MVRVRQIPAGWDSAPPERGGAMSAPRPGGVQNQVIRRTIRQREYDLELQQACARPRTTRSGVQLEATLAEDEPAREFPGQTIDLSVSSDDEQQLDNSLFLSEYIAPYLPRGPCLRWTRPEQPFASVELGDFWTQPGKDPPPYIHFDFKGNDMMTFKAGAEHAIFCASEDLLTNEDPEGLSGVDLADLMVELDPDVYVRHSGALYDERRVQALIPNKWLESPGVKKLQDKLKQLLNAPNHKLRRPNLISNLEGVLPQQMHKDYSPDQLKKHEESGGIPFVVIYAPTAGVSILMKYPDIDEMVRVNIPAKHVLVFPGGQAHAGCDSQPRIHFYFAKAAINTNENEYIGNYELFVRYSKGKEQGEDFEFNGDSGI